ncbi:MAG: tetratricopeptide repeat protein [Bacteriovoracaceae bacterium]
MKILSVLIQITFFGTFIGCSQLLQKKSETASFTPEQVEEMNREALVIASKRLEQMVIQAKSNRVASNYLATDLFLKANMSLLEGDYSTASVLFKHLTFLIPDDEFLQKKYAVSLIRSGDLETAEGVLEKIYKNGKDEKVGLILAGVYVGIDQENKARVVYQEILRKNPKNEDACVFLSKSYIGTKETHKGITQLKACSLKDSKNGMYDYFLGKIYLDLGKPDLAIESFKTASRRQPSLGQSVSALGALFEEKERYSEAISLYASHLKKYPNDQIILARMVQILFLKERFQDVIPYAEKLSDLEPENLNLKVKLGILYTDARKYPEAISVFKDLLAAAPASDKILYYLGAIYQEMNQLHESIEYFNQIPSSSALYTDSAIQMANMLSTLAQEEHFKGEGSQEVWKSAFLKHVNQKIDEFKDLRTEFSVIKSGFYESLGLYKEAMETMIVVQDEKSFSTQHKYYLANLFERQKRYEDSHALILGILEKEPKNAHALNFLGYSMLVRGDEADKAYEYIKKAYEINPEDGYIRDSLGWYYFKKGEMKKALSELELAHKKVPDDIEILKHLATIHKELKDFSKARVYLKSALKHARYHYDKQEIMANLEELERDRLPASGAVD